MFHTQSRPASGPRFQPQEEFVDIECVSSRESARSRGTIASSFCQGGLSTPLRA
jgi:hypothetical protein